MLHEIFLELHWSPKIIFKISYFCIFEIWIKSGHLKIKDNQAKTSFKEVLLPNLSVSLSQSYV